MKMIDVNKYYYDPEKQIVLCEETPLDCVATAHKVQARSVGIFEWTYFYIVDFLAKYFDSFKQRQFIEVKGLASEIVGHQKAFLKKRAEILELVQKKYRVDSNVEHLDEAEVICFGETHTNDRHRAVNAALIDTLCEEDDRILTEHDEDGRRTDQAKYVKHPLKVVGWDLNTDGAIRQLAEASQIQIRSLDEALRVILFGQFPRRHEIKVQKAVQRVFNELPARNGNMCKKIGEHSLKGRRLYVIAGSDHLRPTIYSNTRYSRWLDRRPQDQAFQQTRNYLKTKKFAILTPRRD